MENLLFEPIKIGNVTLKNRIVFPPLTTAYEENHYASKRSKNFYETIARGGAAMVTIGDLSASFNYSMNPLFHDDSFIPSMKEQVDAIHKGGALACAQIYHGEYNPLELQQIFSEQGLDAVKKKMHEDLFDYCNKISLAEIDIIMQRIVDAAVRAKKCGFDVIQIHGDRIVGAFSSPILNKRTDKYGGSTKSRSLFAIELIKNIRTVLPDMPLEYKLALVRESPAMGKGGPYVREAEYFVKELEKAGIDAFHVSIANHSFIGNTIPAMGTMPFGCFTDLAQVVKNAATVPVTTVGRIVPVDLAEQVLKEGKADIIAMGRPLIADPNLPNKIKEDKKNSIRPCIMCNRGCTDNIMHRKYIQCVVNYASGEEINPVITKTAQGKKVLVIGAGPAGLQASVTLAEKGHKVTLVEKDNKIGGQLNLACVPPGKIELSSLIDYYKNMLQINKIEVILNTFADIDFINTINPEIIVIASGALPLQPPIPGTDWKSCVTSWDILSKKESFGENVLVVGGGSVGIETALYMANKGSKVTVVELLDKIIPNEVLTLRPKIFQEIDEYKIKIYLQHKLEKIDNGKVSILSKEGDRLEMNFDTVVLAIGSKPNNSLTKKLIENGFTVTSVGDCSGERVALIGDAIREGFYKTSIID